MWFTPRDSTSQDILWKIIGGAPTKVQRLWHYLYPLKHCLWKQHDSGHYFLVFRYARRSLYTERTRLCALLLAELQAPIHRTPQMFQCSYPLYLNQSFVILLPRFGCYWIQKCQLDRSIRVYGNTSNAPKHRIWLLIYSVLSEVI